MGRFWAVAIVSTMALGAMSLPATAGAPHPTSAWIQPVAGRVTRAFDPPASRFGAGHLGVDLAAPPGSRVHAAGPGVIAFAGVVGPTRHVVIAHAGNLRTSYSFLATVSVRRGQQVDAGDVIGTSGGVGSGHNGRVVHIGLRSGDTYIDPLQLWQPVDLSAVVHLAPTSIAPRAASSPNERRGIIAGFAHGVGAALHAAGTGVTATGRFAGAALVAAGRGARRVAVARFPLQAAAAHAVTTWMSERGHCDSHAPEADGTGGSDHRVMIVAGIDSSSAHGSKPSRLPAALLGFEANEVSYFSYARGGGDYTAADTHQAIADSARGLAAQLRDLERREPGREVDLLAHSQGGVVVEEFLTHVYDSTDPSYPPLGTALALSSPLFGAISATEAAHVARSIPGRAALRFVEAGAQRLGGSIPSSRTPAVRELAEDSPLMRRLRASDLPPGVQLTTIGAATDVLVPGNVASRPGAQQTMVIPRGLNAHSAIVTDPSAMQAARAALEQRPLPCRSLLKIMTQEVVATAISTGERNVGAIATLAAGGPVQP